MEKNKTGKYLKYAVGEIVLVVIGILIALQINNWNENRKDIGKEQLVLVSLLEDFKYSQSSVKRSLQLYPNEIKRLEATLNYIGKSSEELSPEMIDTIGDSGYRTTALASGSIQSVLNTDKLELIRNESLKILLTAYPSEINKFQAQETNVKNIVLNLHRPILESYVALTDFVAEDRNRFPNLKENAEPSDFEGLLKEKKYQNVLVDRMLQTNRLTKVAENYLLKIESIITLLEAEIK
jgi:hypothetical protein